MNCETLNLLLHLLPGKYRCGLFVVLSPELATDSSDMGMHRILGQPDYSGNALKGISIQDEFKYLFLAGG